MRMSRALFDEMVAHARAEYPNECCGIVASVDGGAVRVFPARNEFHSPLRYRMDAKDQYWIQDQIDTQRWDYGAVYHSHTRSAPRPSQTDINEAFRPEIGPIWPGSIYIIIGLENEELDVRAWRIESSTPEAATLEIE